MGVELLSLTERRRGGLKKKVLVSHDGTMRVPQGRYGCEGSRIFFVQLRSSLKLKRIVKDAQWVLRQRCGDAAEALSLQRVNEVLADMGRDSPLG
jgi:hypothetical protein